MNFNWLDVLAKFIFAGFVPPIEIFLVHQDPSLRSFKKNKKSKPNKLWGMTLI